MASKGLALWMILVLAITAAGAVGLRRELVHLYDLAFPPADLYRAVISSDFDFWTRGNIRQYEFDCRYAQRTYELALNVPPHALSSLAIDASSWPALQGRFELLFTRSGRTKSIVTFDGRAETISSGQATEGVDGKILSLATFFVEKCGDSMIELRVMEPAEGGLSLRPTAHFLIRVSPAV